MFRRLIEADYPLLTRWLDEPHMREWWGDPADEIALIRQGEATGELEGWIGYVDGAPIAYLQTWVPSPAAEAEWGITIAPEVTGIDMSIGPADYLDRGFGSRLLAAFARRLFASGARWLMIDPDAANGRAIRAYEKAGFRRFAIGGRDGNTVLMELRPEWLEEQ